MRRLSAILAADVVGYSTLIEADAERVLAALRQLHTEVIGPFVARHRGKLVKSTGDGWLVAFESAVDAVNCAMQVLDTLARHEIFKLRIGVHIGDVVYDDEDVYGDGVNVAARLEALAEPGGVFVSDAVFDSLVGILRASFDDEGEHQLKNIRRPIRVWSRLGAAKSQSNNVCLRREGAENLVGKSSANRVENPIVAVLPFKNLSRDPDQEYFSDGVTEDVVVELSRFSQVDVIARNSSFQLRGAEDDINRVSDVLGARYIVQGTVRRAGEKSRITARLEDSDTGGQIWTERYDRQLEDVFSIQDEIAQMIVGAIAGRIELIDIDRAWRKPTSNMDAYDYYLRRLYYFASWTKSGFVNALLLSERAAKLDPGFAPARALLSNVLHCEWMLGREGEDALFGENHDPGGHQDLRS